MDHAEKYNGNVLTSTRLVSNAYVNPKVSLALGPDCSQPVSTDAFTHMVKKKKVFTTGCVVTYLWAKLCCISLPSSAPLLEIVFLQIPLIRLSQGFLTR